MIHNAVVPFGLALALMGTGVGLWLIGKTLHLTRFKFLVAAAWMVVVLRGGSPGVGGELLVEGNQTGNLLVVGGFIVSLISIGLRPIIDAIANFADRSSP